MHNAHHQSTIISSDGTLHRAFHDGIPIQLTWSTADRIVLSDKKGNVLFDVLPADIKFVRYYLTFLTFRVGGKSYALDLSSGRLNDEMLSGAIFVDITALDSVQAITKKAAVNVWKKMLKQKGVRVINLWLSPLAIGSFIAGIAAIAAFFVFAWITAPHSNVFASGTKLEDPVYGPALVNITLVLTLVIFAVMMIFPIARSMKKKFSYFAVALLLLTGPFFLALALATGFDTHWDMSMIIDFKGRYSDTPIPAWVGIGFFLLLGLPGSIFTALAVKGYLSRKTKQI